ncbi:MAG: dockerin type I domain-containing protein [Oscillospiraceae bacterium]|nr:dockerin type I domain-containing protein [Oscillospiraceae bacterium]
MKNKNILAAAVLSGFMMASGLAVSLCSAQDAVIAGDVNQDGSVTAADILCMKQYLLGVTKSIDKCSDLNNDGKVNIIDLILLKNVLMSEVMVTSAQTDDPQTEVKTSLTTEADVTTTTLQETSITTVSTVKNENSLTSTQPVSSVQTTVTTTDATTVITDQTSAVTTTAVPAANKDEALLEQINKLRSENGIWQLEMSYDLCSTADLLIGTAAASVDDQTPYGKVDIELPAGMAFYQGKFSCYCLESDDPAAAAEYIRNDPDSGAVDSRYVMMGMSYCRLTGTSSNKNIWYFIVM